MGRCWPANLKVMRPSRLSLIATRPRRNGTEHLLASVGHRFTLDDDGTHLHDIPHLRGVVTPVLIRVIQLLGGLGAGDANQLLLVL